jgi:mono/diheme cytochrome c family protein
MKKPYLGLVAFLILIVLLLVACGEQAATPASLIDTGEYERPDPPEEYTQAVNPMEGDPAAVSAGETLFQQNCVSCHGTTGKGDGPAGSALTPKPADLGAVQISVSDGYLFWRITEGGMMEPFRSVMPAWKGIMDEEKTWQVVSYIRTLSE